MVPMDTATGDVGRPIVVGTLPAALALVPGGRSLLVAVKADDQLVEVSTATGKVEGTVGVGLEPDAVAVTPDGSTALVANFGAATVTEVHLASLTAGPTGPSGASPWPSPSRPTGAGPRCQLPGGTMTPIALPSLSPGPPVAVGAEPVAVAVPRSGSVALVADFQTSGLTPVALPSLVPGPEIAVGANPTGIAIPAGGSVTWVSAGDGVTPVWVAGGLVGRAVPIDAPAQCIAAVRPAGSGCAAATGRWSRSPSPPVASSAGWSSTACRRPSWSPARRRSRRQLRTGGSVGDGGGTLPRNPGGDEADVRRWVVHRLVERMARCCGRRVQKRGLGPGGDPGGHHPDEVLPEAQDGAGWVATALISHQAPRVEPLPGHGQQAAPCRTPT